MKITSALTALKLDTWPGSPVRARMRLQAVTTVLALLEEGWDNLTDLQIVQKKGTDQALVPEMLKLENIGDPLDLQPSAYVYKFRMTRGKQSSQYGDWAFEEPMCEELREFFKRVAEQTEIDP